MAQTINTNVMSLTAQRNLNNSQSLMATSMQRLSSGLRINSAKDDAAGLAIAERMNTQVRGMNVAVRNANDGISLAQTAEGGLDEIGSMLQRMRELAVQSANGTYSAGDRENLNVEYQSLAAEIGRISETTTFNGLKVIGSNAGDVAFQVGANAGQILGVTTTDVTTAVGVTAARAGSIGGSTGGAAVEAASAVASTGSAGAPNGDGVAAVTAASATGATAAMTALDTAIGDVTTARARLGAVQSRFESAISNLQIGIENQAAARGRIVDADFAVESAALTRSQILQQAGSAMVSQANSAPANVLALLG